MMYNFKRLVKKYGGTLHIIRQSEGFHDPTQGGQWVPGEVEEIEIEGAVVPLSRNDLQYDEGGTWTRHDRKLYTYEAIDKGEKVKHDADTYTVQESLNYTDFDDGLQIYFIRRASDE